jgi:hypothetical protein
MTEQKGQLRVARRKAALRQTILCLVIAGTLSGCGTTTESASFDVLGPLGPYAKRVRIAVTPDCPYPSIDPSWRGADVRSERDAFVVAVTVVHRNCAVGGGTYERVIDLPSSLGQRGIASAAIDGRRPPLVWQPPQRPDAIRRLVSAPGTTRYASKVCNQVARYFNGERRDSWCSS